MDNQVGLTQAILVQGIVWLDDLQQASCKQVVGLFEGGFNTQNLSGMFHGQIVLLQCQVVASYRHFCCKKELLKVSASRSAPIIKFGAGVFGINASQKFASVQVDGFIPVHNGGGAAALLQSQGAVGIEDKGIGIYPTGVLRSEVITVSLPLDIAGSSAGPDVWLKRPA